ncbi:MAG: hypothetical protein ACREK1_00130 [Longimicrobiales bacterium]
MQLSRCVPLAVILAGTVLGACNHAPVADPDYVRVESDVLLAACELEPEKEFTGWAGLAGATLSGGGISLTVPEGALLQPTEFRIRIPSSPYAEVEIHANGQEHYQFLLPVVISIDYSQCDTTSGDLTAWQIDPETKALLENMGGVNDVLNQRVTFSTTHLSGYAIAN